MFYCVPIWLRWSVESSVLQVGESDLDGCACDANTVCTKCVPYAHSA